MYNYKFEISYTNDDKDCCIWGIRTSLQVYRKVERRTRITVRRSNHRLKYNHQLVSIPVVRSEGEGIGERASHGNKWYFDHYVGLLFFLGGETPLFEEKQYLTELLASKIEFEGVPLAVIFERGRRTTLLT